MTSYADRLKKLGKAWENDKPAQAGFALPPDKYQFEVKSAKPDEGKAKFNKGHLQIKIELQVITGPMKGRKAFVWYDLDQEANIAKGFPSGMSRFKGLLETWKIEMPKRLDEAGMKSLLKEFIGIVCNGAAVQNNKGYTNIYLNDLIDAPEASDDDEEEVTDEDETEDSDEDSDETSEDGEDSDDDSEDDEDEDEDSEDEDSDDEEEKPAPKPQVKTPTTTAKKPAPSTKPQVKPAKVETDDDEWGAEFDNAGKKQA